MSGAIKLVLISCAFMWILWWFLFASSPMAENWHGCIDEENDCKARVAAGECKSKRETMKRECKSSCGFCDHFHSNCMDSNEKCKEWAKLGECTKNPSFMVKGCQRSCGSCVACLEIRSPNFHGTVHITDSLVEGHPAYTSTDTSLSLLNKTWSVIARKTNKQILKLPDHTDTPFEGDTIGKWLYLPAGSDVWVPNRFITVTEISCDTGNTFSTPDELLTSRIELKEGVHYHADYNLSNLKPPPASYAYPKNADPAFLYPEDLTDAPKIQFHILSYEPKIYYFPRFLTDEEADDVIDEAKKRLERSSVVPIKGKNSSGLDDVRTSSGCWLDNSHKSVEKLRRRMLAVTGFHTDQTEKLQVLRYKLGQKYNSHLDYYQPHGARNEQEAREMWRLKWNNNWNRAATFFLYLYSTEEGGETTLPRSNGGPQPLSMTDCTKGLRVRPIKGAAVLFYDMKPDKTQDEYSLHGGCPVIKGEKWAAPQWLHVKVRDEGASGGFW
eukprot:TRINITY_DN1086_c5_g1_i1.p1 TRINITY_DN1086_c5_g1~~TRINITY_DN1086_c5_g1_i1.p1  ORF type:complete len:506 (+),score=63.86 TRINITY_DN1086_c5_g1_i1:29-1519(+)